MISRLFSRFSLGLDTLDCLERKMFSKVVKVKNVLGNFIRHFFTVCVERSDLQVFVSWTMADVSV